MEAEAVTGGHRDKNYVTSTTFNEKIARSKSFDCDSVKSLTVENLREKIRKSKTYKEKMWVAHSLII